MNEFEEKCRVIELARKKYPEFDQEFKDYLGLGYGWNGAYNHFTLEDIAKYEPKVEPVVEPVKPAAPAKK